MKILKVFFMVLDYLEQGLLAVGIFIMIVMNFVNVVCRFLLPQVPFAYTEEFTTLLFVWCTVIGISRAFKQHAHMGLTLITDRLKPSVHRVFVLFSAILCVVMMVILVKAGWSVAMN